jgi:hypothetical protein
VDQSVRSNNASRRRISLNYLEFNCAHRAFD